MVARPGEPPGEGVPGRIVVTGFGAFPGVADNPSAALIEALRQAPGLLPEGTQYRVLEVAYAALPDAVAAIFADPPAALVLTGYSALAQGLRLETRAHSYCSPDHADALGRVGDSAAKTTARDWLAPCRVDLRGLAAGLREAGLHCALSDDAGAYLCNHVYHQALRRIGASGAATRAVFVHLPAIAGTSLATRSAGTMELAAMARGVALIARVLAQR